MKKTAAIITAAIMAASSGVSVSAEDGNKLVVLGDSITSGYGLDGYTEGDNYSAESSFANLLGGSYDEYLNFAVDGRTSEELLTALEDEKISAELSGADTVVVSIGGNDFLQPMFTAALNMAAENMEIFSLLSGMASGSGDNLSALTSGIFSSDSADMGEYSALLLEFINAMTEAAEAVDISQIAGNISSILGIITEEAPDSQVIILTVYNPFEGVPGLELFDAVARTRLAELNAAISDAAARNGARTADVYSAFEGHALEYTNISRIDIHPNKTGHAVIYSLLSDMTGESAVSEEVPAEEAMLPAKGSPDTGVGGIAVFAGIAAFAGGLAAISRKKKS